MEVTMPRVSTAVLALLIAACAPAAADERNRVVEVPAHWTRDLDAAFSKAREEGKPLLVVFRCDP
jgi:hypothetical protein